MYLLSILKAQGRDRKGGLMKDPTLTMPAYRRNHYQDPKFQQQYMCLGHKISTLRTSMGISQRQLADVVGISRSYLSKLECGYGISPVNCYIFVCKTINPVIDIFQNIMKESNFSDEHTSAFWS